jgi:hypothetical protein
MTFETIDLSVLVGPDRQLWISASSRLGALHAVPRRPSVSWTIDDIVDRTAAFTDAVRQGDPVPDEIAEIGASLRELLFGDPDVLGLFQKTRGVAAELKRQLLVRILAAPREVAGLPWELTFDPDAGAEGFLTLAPDAHVVRMARARTYPISDQPVELPLEVLLILSSPIVSFGNDNSLSFDLYEERRAMLDELEPLVAAGLISVEVEDRPTVEAIRRRISGKRFGYHVVHYLGHALAGQLLLENGYGVEAPIEAVAFTELLSQCPDLRLVVYAGCETAQSPEVPADPANEDWRGSLSVADLTVRIAAPAVVGMQAVLPFRTERLFAHFFYRSLAAGRDVASAVQSARAAIRGDEYVGGDLLDWSVPALFVGDQPGSIIDPRAVGHPPERVRRAEIKLDLEESDREAFARSDALRQAMDVLSGRHEDRLLIVTGAPELRRPFFSRVLDDLGHDVDMVLYSSAKELAVKPPDDPLLMACGWLAELLTRIDGTARRPQRGWDGAAWWNRLLEDFADCRAVIVIDDVDAHEAGAILAPALARLALRRTQARVAIGGTSLTNDFLEPRVARRSRLIALRPLPWDDVYRWIRRNLPVLLRYDELVLRKQYDTLVDDLELWTGLGRAISSKPRLQSAALEPLEPLVAGVVGMAERPNTRATRAPLKAAMTNPDVDAHRFADRITRLATDHRIGGRVVDADRRGEASSIAELLPVPSPYSADSSARDETELIKWVEEAVQKGANAILLDFGANEVSDAWSALVDRMTEQGVFTVAAGGNDGGDQPIYPGWLPGVLGVGAVTGQGKLEDYSNWDPGLGKPDLFAPGTVEWEDQKGGAPRDYKGTSYAALDVLATALLVWSIDPSLKPNELRQILLDTATRRKAARGQTRGTIRVLNAGAAFREVRRRSLLAVLRTGPATYQDLLAATGLARDMALELIQSMIDSNELRRVVMGGTERLAVAEVHGS